jgi:hypothetical protein
MKIRNSALAAGLVVSVMVASPARGHPPARNVSSRGQVETARSSGARAANLKDSSTRAARNRRGRERGRRHAEGYCPHPDEKTRPANWPR